LCVTHLGQIAAYADAHFRIEKGQSEGRTVTRIERLGEPERVVEVAQMLAGSEGGAAARASAEELLGRAGEWRRTAAEG
jgi:DNA repair protein RecN (Recombination protein N)